MSLVHWCTTCQLQTLFKSKSWCLFWIYRFSQVKAQKACSCQRASMMFCTDSTNLCLIFVVRGNERSGRLQCWRICTCYKPSTLVWLSNTPLTIQKNHTSPTPVCCLAGSLCVKFVKACLQDHCPPRVYQILETKQPNRCVLLNALYSANWSEKKHKYLQILLRSGWKSPVVIANSYTCEQWRHYSLYYLVSITKQ